MKFRSQTSDNFDRWKSRGGKSQRREEKRREKRRREEKKRRRKKKEGRRKKKEERSEERKGQKTEDAGARKGSKVAKHCVFPMICGSGGSKSRLAKAAAAGPSGEMRWEMKKLRSSTFRSQNVQSTTTTTTTTTATLHYCCNYKYKYTTLHYATLRYTALHCATLRYTTLHYATLRYTTLHYATLRYTTLHYATLIAPHHDYNCNCNYTTLITLHYNYNSTTLHCNYNCTTPHYIQQVWWGDHCNHCNHSKKHNSNNLSVHQWIRSAIRDSQQLTSPIGFLFLKLPPPPCAVLQE